MELALSFSVRRQKDCLFPPSLSPPLPSPPYGEHWTCDTLLQSPHDPLWTVSIGMPGIFKAPFWCVVSVCEKVWEPIFFRIVWLSDWRRRLVSWVVFICSCVSSNTKLPVAHLSVAMSCDEKNNKRRKKRSKQSSEGNSHAPKSVENREVCRPNIKHTQCSFH